MSEGYDHALHDEQLCFFASHTGELDFEEFKVILNGRLGAGSGSSGSSELVWQHASEGTWNCHVPTGGVFGEVALVQGLVRAACCRLDC